eukprot:TRINITY_DN19430_c0_g1_i2.p1 TRINITY_DN19430_c0_g1~~TRINITY_DN19430_c0_g1_i2.p1  ORF type:complete len:1369 (-),score=253.86 TRINITY_DN19430_c0_g1_i2:73-3903(-)
MGYNSTHPPCHLQGHDLCADVVPFNLRVVLNSFLIPDRGKLSWYNNRWLVKLARWNTQILVLNRGNRYRLTDQLLAELRKTLTAIRELYPALLVVWRSAVGGHPNCGAYSAPLTERLDPRQVTFSDNWDKIPAQNEAVRSLMKEFGVVYLDVETATSLRPDGHHVLSDGTMDCAHWCMPGPVDHWVTALYNTLLLLGPGIGAGSTTEAATAGTDSSRAASGQWSADAGQSVGAVEVKKIDVAKPAESGNGESGKGTSGLSSWSFWGTKKSADKGADTTTANPSEQQTEGFRETPAGMTGGNEQGVPFGVEEEKSESEVSPDGGTENRQQGEDGEEVVKHESGVLPDNAKGIADRQVQPSLEGLGSEEREQLLRMHELQKQTRGADPESEQVEQPESQQQGGQVAEDQEGGEEGSSEVGVTGEGVTEQAVQGDSVWHAVDEGKVEHLASREQDALGEGVQPGPIGESGSGTQNEATTGSALRGSLEDGSHTATESLSTTAAGLQTHENSSGIDSEQWKREVEGEDGKTSSLPAEGLPTNEAGIPTERTDQSQENGGESDVESGAAEGLPASEQLEAGKEGVESSKGDEKEKEKEKEKNGEIEGVGESLKLSDKEGTGMPKDERKDEGGDEEDGPREVTAIDGEEHVTSESNVESGEGKDGSALSGEVREGGAGEVDGETEPAENHIKDESHLTVENATSSSGLSDLVGSIDAMFPTSNSTLQRGDPGVTTKNSREEHDDPSVVKEGGVVDVAKDDWRKGHEGDELTTTVAAMVTAVGKETDGTHKTGESSTKVAKTDTAKVEQTMKPDEGTREGQKLGDAEVQGGKEPSDVQSLASEKASASESSSGPARDVTAVTSKPSGSSTTTREREREGKGAEKKKVLDSKGAATKGGAKANLNALVPKGHVPGTDITAPFARKFMHDVMLCLSNGSWVYNATPRELPWDLSPAGEQQRGGSMKVNYKSCDIQHAKKDGGVYGADADAALANGESAKWRVRKSLKYEWKTRHPLCQFRHFNRHDFCRAVRGRNIVLVGDHSQFQLHDALLNHLAGGKGSDVEGTLGDSWESSGGRGCYKVPHKLCTGEKGGGARPFELRLVHNELLTPGKFSGGEGNVKWLPFLKQWKTGIVIMNRGALYRPTQRYEETLKETLQRFRKEYPNILLLWRSTAIGHASCDDGTAAPLQRLPPNSTLGDHAANHWKQNEITYELIRQVGGVYLDVTTPTALRPDGHLLLANGSRDCWSYCLPGPPDLWVDLLYNALVVIEKTQRKQRAREKEEQS